MRGDYFVKVTAGTATSAKRETEAMSQGGERGRERIKKKGSREKKETREGQEVEEVCAHDKYVITRHKE